MRVASSLWGGRPHRVLWGFIRGETARVDTRWFWSRFLAAATLLAARWWPSTKRRGIPLGRGVATVVLVALWVGVPLLLLGAVARDLATRGW